MSDLIGQDQIAEITRYLDAESEEFEDMPGFFRKRGVDIEGLTHVAMQRGLRTMMIRKGINPNQTKPVGVMLSPTEVKEQTHFALQFLNGVAVGMAIERSKHEHGA